MSLQENMSIVDYGILRRLFDKNPEELWKLKQEILEFGQDVDEKYLHDPNDFLIEVFTKAEYHFISLKTKESLGLN